MTAHTEIPTLDSLLDDRSVEIIVCCGSGGVGKTTTAASVALRAADRGRKVVVLTIDPARRLAQSLGVEQLDNTPRPVAGVDPSESGSLDAMMLDMKRTFDEVVLSQTTPEKAQAILANPFYVTLSSSFAGTQEYMAMEKLGQVHRDSVTAGTHDLVVVDTPPSRSALDFLDAPERLSSFLDGRFVRLLAAPAKGSARVLGAGAGLASKALSKVLGTEFLKDLQLFLSAFDTLFGGFRARAERTYSLLQNDRTRFVVVATPDADALGEAEHFVERLASDGIAVAGVVVNRATSAPDVSESDLLGLDPALARAALALVSQQNERARAEEAVVAEFSERHPQVPLARVPRLGGDVHDLDGLRSVGSALASATAALAGQPDAP